MIAPLEATPAPLSRCNANANANGNANDGERVVDMSLREGGASLAELAAVYDESVDVVRLRRSFRTDLVRLAERAFVLSFRGPPDAIDLDAAFPGDLSDAARAVRDDLLTWTRVFGDLLEAREVGVRIVCGDRPMCPSFHVDRVIVRLVTAYVGAGTEWLGRSARARASSVEEAVRRATAADHHRAAQSDIVLLKGDGFAPGARGVIHRSPPHQGPRLLASIDALEI